MVFGGRRKYDCLSGCETPSDVSAWEWFLSSTSARTGAKFCREVCEPVSHTHLSFMCMLFRLVVTRSSLLADPLLFLAVMQLFLMRTHTHHTHTHTHTHTWTHTHTCARTNPRPWCMPVYAYMHWSVHARVRILVHILVRVPWHYTEHESAALCFHTTCSIWHFAASRLVQEEHIGDKE